MRRLAASIVTLLVLAVGLVVAPPATAQPDQASPAAAATMLDPQCWLRNADDNAEINFPGNGVRVLATMSYRHCATMWNSILQKMHLSASLDTRAYDCSRIHRVTLKVRAYDRNEGHTLVTRQLRCQPDGYVSATWPAFAVPTLEENQRARYRVRVRLWRNGKDVIKTVTARLGWAS